MPTKKKNSEPAESVAAGKAADTNAAKADQDAYDPSTVVPLWKALILLFLAAQWSTASQLYLSPSHGSFPASLHHKAITINALLMTVPLDIVLLAVLPVKEKPYLLPVLSLSMPVLQFVLSPSARLLGPVWSAVLIETVTYGAVVVLTLNVTWQSFRQLVPSFIGEPLRTFVPPVLAAAWLYAFEGWGAVMLPQLVTNFYPYINRTSMQTILGVLTSATLPSKYLLYAFFPFLHSFILNPHMPMLRNTRGLQYVLQQTDNFTLIDRSEGLTGYLSVLQDDIKGFKVLRCDHSLLGGEWVYGVGQWEGGGNYAGKIPAIGEPVYSVFAMLEAVRLVKDAGSKSKGTSDKDANALVIGLGIGTTPSALAAHGVDTTVVEIDPGVARFALKYFTPPVKNYTLEIQDAIPYVFRAKEQFSYIIHDVFTGGAEPAELFTFEFLEQLARILKDDGVAAINYAGDLALPSTSLVARTILSAFPNCRIFRETEPLAEANAADFTNMVFFCRKKLAKFDFRDPTNSDILGSMIRNHALMPKYEVDTGIFELLDEEGGADPKEPRKGKQETVEKILRSGKTQALELWQKKGAVEHWNAMRTVLSPNVWEGW